MFVVKQIIEDARKRYKSGEFDKYQLDRSPDDSLTHHFTNERTGHELSINVPSAGMSQ